MIDILTKCHTNQTFLLITLKVQNIHYICTFSQKVFLSPFCDFSFCIAHVKYTCQPSESNNPLKVVSLESSDSRRVLNPKLTRVVTIGTLQYSMLMLILLCRRKRRRRNGYHLFQVLRGHYYCCHYLTWLWQRRLIFLYLSLPRSSSEKMYV